MTCLAISRKFTFRNLVIILIFGKVIVIKNVGFLVKQIQSELDVISKWCLKWSFKMSGPKSVGVLFTQKKKLPEINLEISGNPVAMKKSAKFLGLIFDSHLTWNEHIIILLTEAGKD